MCVLCNTTSLYRGSGNILSAQNTSFLTGQNHIDSLLFGLSWSGITGKSAQINYALQGNSILDIDQNYFSAIKGALREWASVANISFKNLLPSPQNNSSTQIKFSLDTSLLDSDILGVTFPISVEGTNKFSSTQISVASQLNLAPGNLSGGFITILHEIGHALGLKHPGNYGGGGESEPILPVSDDSQDLSVMSYIAGKKSGFNNIASTPMLYDIAAIQYLYGANTGHNSGNNLYNFDGTTNVRAIWDGGGNDTIDISSSTLNSKIDLREGKDNFTQFNQTYVWAAFGANIESGISGSGNDTIFGNNLDNFLNSNSGNDTIQAFQGNDTINTGSGNDTIRAGKGDDVILGNEGNDEIFGDIGNDTMFAGKGDDTLIDGNGNDVVYGDRGNDIIFSNNGNDIYVFQKESGIDTIFSFAPGVDKIQVSSDIFTSPEVAKAHVTGSGSIATINFGDGNVVNLIGVSFTQITTSDFIIS